MHSFLRAPFIYVHAPKMELLIETAIWVGTGGLFAIFSVWFLIDSMKDLRFLNPIGAGKSIRTLLVWREIRMAIYLCASAILGLIVTLDSVIPNIILEERQLIGRISFLLIEIILTLMIIRFVLDKRQARKMASKEATEKRTP